MTADYSALTDTQLRQMVGDSERRIADAVATSDRFVIANLLYERGDLLRELKRRNLTHLADAVRRGEDGR